jgi:hypothetical protein
VIPAFVKILAPRCHQHAHVPAIKRRPGRGGSRVRTFEIWHTGVCPIIGAYYYIGQVFGLFASRFVFRRRRTRQQAANWASRAFHVDSICWIFWWAGQV